MHLDLFEQPGVSEFFSNLLGGAGDSVASDGIGGREEDWRRVERLQITEENGVDATWHWS